MAVSELAATAPAMTITKDVLYLMMQQSRCSRSRSNQFGRGHSFPKADELVLSILSIDVFSPITHPFILVFELLSIYEIFGDHTIG